MQTIISEYFMELVAGISIIALLLLYSLVKVSKKNVDAEPEEVNLETPSESKQSSEVQTSTTTQIEPKEELQPQNEPYPPVTSQRVKREVVPHDRIKKDDFSIFNNVRILIAEDNVINQKIITSLLADSGIYIAIANNGQECLDILKDDSNFSIIFMDAHMPIIDGFQATRLIRQNPEYDHLPIVALSGDTAADDIRNMLNVGMEAHLEKPLRMNPFYDMIYMYTTGDENKENSIQPNNHISEEFDSDKGLNICGGDKEFYLEILNDFISKYADSADNLQKHLNSTNSIDADKMLLDISGVAANIGADNLHTLSLALKDSIANPTDLKYISDLKEYKRSLIKVCEAINNYITP
ncbi:MAG: response regulator [Sulfurimonas sp.]|nr:response regulator [Sulfurimonas sp.]